MSSRSPEFATDRDYLTIPLPEVNGQARIIGAASSRFVLLELMHNEEVPGEPDVFLLTFRKLWPLHRARFYVRFFAQAAQLVEERGKLLPDGTRIHPIRLNEPGQYTEVAVWLTADHCRMLSAGLTRQIGLALAVPMGES